MTNLIILVHGTWGKADDAWYQKSGEPESFFNRLQEALKNNGMTDPILIPFEWEHDNDHLQRVNAAERLADKLIQFREEYQDARFHFIAHSHGGNVVLKAIEIYLDKLKKSLMVGSFFYSNIAIAERCKFILEQYSLQDGEPLLLEDKDLEETIRKLILDLDRTLSHGDLWRIFFSFDEYMFGRKKFNPVIDRLITDKRHHRLENIITFGTPFYFKEWRISPLSNFIDHFINIILFLLILLGSYFVILFYAALGALFPLVKWIGFNPCNWPWLINLIYAILIIMFSNAFRSLFSSRSKNTNIYFDVSKINKILKTLEDRKLCRALIVHASYLDEAYLGLSAFPIFDPVMKHKIKDFGKPRFWNFEFKKKRAGVIKDSFSGTIRRWVNNIGNLVITPVLAFGYPVRYLICSFYNWLLCIGVSKYTKKIALGLPDDEFDESSIKVKNIPDLQYFDVRPFDVSEHVKIIPLNTKQELDRYSYLWSDAELSERIFNSKLAEYMRVCGYRVMSASNGNDKKKKIQNFKLEFKSKKKGYEVLLIHSKKIDNQWMIVVFNNGLFKTLSSDGPSTDLSLELKEKSANENKIVELVSSKLATQLKVCCSHFHMKPVNNVNDMNGVIQEYKSNKKKRAVWLAYTTNAAIHWVIIGFNKGGFITITSDDPNNDLSKNLKKEPIDEKEIFKSVKQKLGCFVDRKLISKAQQRHILALEERGKEFYGVTGLRHSMYYENKKVIEEISRFLVGK